jgi:hypothetical protein
MESRFLRRRQLRVGWRRLPKPRASQDAEESDDAMENKLREARATQVQRCLSMVGASAGMEVGRACNTLLVY